MSEKYHDALMQRLDMIGGLGENASRLTNAAVARQMPEINMPAPNYDAYTGPSTESGIPGAMKFGGRKAKSPGGQLGSFLNAIAGQESGGNYGARNKDTGAMGKYQIMPGNIQGNRGWDYEALGRNISTSQFMGNSQLQEQIARYKLTQYYNKYGAAGAAVAWYAGPGAVARYNRGGGNGNEGAYPSIRAYVNSILAKMK